MSNNNRNESNFDWRTNKDHSAWIRKLHARSHPNIHTAQKDSKTWPLLLFDQSICMSIILDAVLCYAVLCCVVCRSNQPPKYCSMACCCNLQTKQCLKMMHSPFYWYIYSSIAFWCMLICAVKSHLRTYHLFYSDEKRFFSIFEHQIVYKCRSTAASHFVQFST